MRAQCAIGSPSVGCASSKLSVGGPEFMRSLGDDLRLEPVNLKRIYEKHPSKNSKFLVYYVIRKCQ